MAYTLSWIGNIPPGGGGGSGALGLEQDWIDRSTASGVTQAIRFDVEDNVLDWVHPDGNASRVTQDLTDGILGDGCIKIDFPSSLGAASGQWRIPQNTAWTTDTQAFGSTPYWVQYRCKISSGKLVPSTGGAGFKFSILGEYRFSSPASSNSNVNNELVVQNTFYRSIFQAYRQDGTTFQPFETTVGSDIYFQNEIDNGPSFTDPLDRYCLYDAGAASPGCFFIPENEWFTVQQRVELPSVGGTTGNRYDLWIARATDTTFTHLISATNFQVGGGGGLTPNGPNALWLLPYDTSRTSASYDAWHKYDQVIVSTAEIACPQPLPAWFSGSLNTWFNAGAGSRLSVAQTYTEPSSVSHSGFCSYSGATAIGTKLYVAGGGHGDGASNAVFVYDLSEDAPVATLLNTPSSSVQTNVSHYADGKPSSRHTSWDLQGVPARNRLFFMGGWAHYGNGGSSDDAVDAFRLDTNAYEGSGTYTAQSGLQSGNAPNAVCQDTSGNVYIWICGSPTNNLYKWTQSTATWSTMASSSHGVIYTSPMAYDPVRDRLVLIDGANSAYYDLGTNTKTTFTTTATRGASFFWCSDLGVFLYKVDGSMTIEQIDPTTFVKSAYSVSGTAPAVVGGVNGIDSMFGRVGYIDSLGIVYALTQTSTNLSAFRIR